MTYLHNDLQKRARKSKQHQKWLVLSKAGGVAAAAFLVIGLANWQDAGVEKPPLSVSLPPVEVVEPPKNQTPTMPNQEKTAEPTPQKTNLPAKTTPQDTKKARTEPVNKTQTDDNRHTPPPTGENQLKPSVTPPANPPVSPTNIPAPAWAHFQKIVGEKASEYQVHPSLSNEKTGQYYFTKMVNGIPYLDNGYLVQVQGEKSQSLSLSGDKTVDTKLFPDPAIAIPLEQAEQIFADSVELAYVKNQSKLIYIPRLFGNINAVDGTVKNDTHKQLVSIKPKGIRYVRNEKEATALFSEELQVPFDNIRFWDDSSKNNSNQPQLFKSYYWKSPDEQRSVSLKVRADTGQVVSYSYHDSKKSSKKTINQVPMPTETYIHTASLFLEKFLDTSIKQLRVKDITMNSYQITIQFYAVHHNIAIIDRSFEISLDLETQHVIAMDGDMATNTDSLPDPAPTIPRETAIERLLEDEPLELVYANSTEQPGTKQTPQLMYTIIKKETARTAIDAGTGKRVRW